MKKQSSNQAGLTLVEVVIGVALLMLMGAVVLKLTVWRNQSQFDSETVQRAQDVNFSAFNALTGAVTQLADGGSFEPSANSVLTLKPCTAQTCDFILLPADAAPLDSIAKGARWQNEYTAPDTARIQFVRRWHKAVLNADLKLYNLTIAIFPDENSTEPISYETKTIYAE